MRCAPRHRGVVQPPGRHPRSREDDFEAAPGEGARGESRRPVPRDVPAGRCRSGPLRQGFDLGPVTLFVGMYDVLAMSERNGSFPDPLIGQSPDEHQAWHELKHSDRMQKCEEKLVIEWGAGYRAWRQRAKRQNKKVLEIRPQPNEPLGARV
jgi:hypothetical protein